MSSEMALAEWLERRFDLVTASDVPAIMGLNPYCSRKQILREKLARQSQNLEDNARVQAGVHLERGIFEWFLHAHGFKGVHNTERMIVTSPASGFPWLGCTPDAWLELDDSTRRVPVEIKNVGFMSQWTKEPESELCVPDVWTAEAHERQYPRGEVSAPLYYVVQLLTQMHCLDAVEGWLVVLVGGQARLDLHYRRRRAWEDNVMLPAVADFWRELEGARRGQA